MARQKSPDSAGRNAGRVPTAVFLVGFMAAGKTTIGRLLAGKLGWRFIDLDDLVEAEQGRTVAEIFRDSGEPAFRAAEAAALERVLEELAGGTRTVVAVGGGAFVQPRNAAAIRDCGHPAVFLDAPVEELRKRCHKKGGVRPLFEDEDRFRRLYLERRSAYLQADLQVETTGKTADDVADELISLLGLGKK